MKYFLILLLLVGIYLWWSYASFYNHILSKTLPKPTLTTYEVGQGRKTLKYVSLGDSLTAGVGVADKEETYPYLLAKSLSQDKTQVIVYNLSHPGSETKDLLNSQLEGAISQNPDLVTILIGINDIHNKVSQSRFRKNYQEIVTNLKNKTQAKIVLINIPFLGSSKTLWFPWNLVLDYKTRQFNKVIKSAAGENNLKLIDLYSPTKKAFDKDQSLYSEDNFHPSKKGYILWGQIINADISK